MPNDETEEEVPSEDMVTHKVFERHVPSGFVVHTTLTVAYPKAGPRLTNWLDYLVTHDFEPHEGWGSSQAGPPAKVDPNAPKCEECGTTMTYREGTSKKGNPYRVWNCPKDKNHPPIWVNDDD